MAQLPQVPAGYPAYNSGPPDEAIDQQFGPEGIAARREALMKSLAGALLPMDRIKERYDQMKSMFGGPQPDTAKYGSRPSPNSAVDPTDLMMAGETKFTGPSSPRYTDLYEGHKPMWDLPTEAVGTDLPLRGEEMGTKLLNERSPSTYRPVASNNPLRRPKWDKPQADYLSDPRYKPFDEVPPSNMPMSDADAPIPEIPWHKKDTLHPPPKKFIRPANSPMIEFDDPFPGNNPDWNEFIKTPEGGWSPKTPILEDLLSKLTDASKKSNPLMDAFNNINKTGLKKPDKYLSPANEPMIPE